MTITHGQGESDMKRHGGGPIRNTSTRLGRFALAIVGSLVILGSLLGAATASAKAPVELPDLSFECEAAHTCEGRISVDEETGDVYAIDPSNDAVNRFSSDGTYLSQLKVPAAPESSGSFGFSAADDDIAVDNFSSGANRGNVYVAGEGGNFISAFDQEGNFLWQVPIASGYACGIAVDPSGNPWYANYEDGLYELNADTGASTGTVIPNGASPCHFAFDSTGDILLSEFNGPIAKLSPSGTVLFGLFRETGAGGAPASTDVAVNISDDSIYLASFYGGGGDGARRWSVDGVEFPEDPFLAGEQLSVTVDAAHARVYYLKQGDILAFSTLEHALAASKAGEGAVSCDTGDGPEPCSSSYSDGEEITLSAAPADGWEFAGWADGSGDAAACAGTEPCEITLTQDSGVEAQFTQIVHSLSVAVSGDGSVSCDTGSGPEPCAAEYPEGEFITLRAMPGAHQKFTGWSGACGNKAGACVIEELSGDTEVGASFAPITHKLTVLKLGSGSVLCDGEACQAEYEEGQSVRLSAAPSSGFDFTGWSGGGCSGTGTCTVTLDADATITASFKATESSGGGGGGGSGDGGGSTTTPPATSTPTPSPKPKACKKGSVKKHGKCVRKRKHPKHHKRHRRHRG